MDWLLFALMLFNLLSVVAVYWPRNVPRRVTPWLVFFTALPATEVAWLWLPLQMLISWLLVQGGALESSLGQLSLSVLALSWLGLAGSIYLMGKAEGAVQDSLKADLGSDFLASLPVERRATLRKQVSFSDWCRPMHMHNPAVEVTRNIAYGDGGIRQQLDVYRPKSRGTEPLPVLLQIHGGAWMYGDKAHQALPLMYHLASRGWICVAANYRLSPSVGFPTHLHDCKAALCWIRQHAEEYGMDPEFVAVTGGSAGGHLTALMGLTENRPELQPDCPDTDTSVQACVPFYGVYDLMTRHGQHPNKEVFDSFLTGSVFHQSPQDNPELWKLGSPMDQIHEDAPPFMILHGQFDSLAVVKEGQVFAEQLRKVSKQPVVYTELPGAEHAWDTLNSLRTAHTVDGIHQFLEWVRAQA